MDSIRSWTACRSLVVLGVLLNLAGSANCSHAAEPIHVVEARRKAEAAFLESVRKKYEAAKEAGDVVIEVRVLTVVCSAARKDDDDKLKSVTLQIAMQVLSVEKGPIKKNEIVVVSRDVETPQIVTIKHYNTGTKQVDMLNGKNVYPNIGYSPQFPLAPGAKGNVTLRWDVDRRVYVPTAGWLIEPSPDGIPVEVGKALSAKD